jgi:hypothetical protein
MPHGGTPSRHYGTCPAFPSEPQRDTVSGAEAGHMVVSNPNSPKAKLTGSQKWVIAGLICLQVPSGAILYPLATVIVLTGVGAPLSMILLRIGTMPFSLAMKRKAAWQSGEEPEIDHDRRPRVSAGDGFSQLGSPDPTGSP